ncbi:hypothetical protein BAE44_0021767 [Dichanthelium oligosanthes]|uniref:Peptidase A1 domain-containing protein n=1 Tax=Dichanthelium oligosanthes TaxID=888268 RepID=A0A1E5UWR5_9POAL|nr:hypothetical protein BAE44_0021767 [Dichanthelium oligosanthes]
MQCKPVDDEPFQQTPPPFDPSTSPSLVPENPMSPFCSNPTWPSAKCHFDANGEDNSSATGFLVRDTFAFGSSEVPGYLFGCAHRTEGFQSHGVLAGVLSLGKRDGSLPMELLGKRGVHRFSYCLPPGAAVAGPPRVYLVRMVGVSVAGRRLPGIDAGTFAESRYGGGTVIDLGTATMVMVEAAYRALERAVDEHVKHLRLARVSYGGYVFCLRLGGGGANNKDDDVWEHLPTVTLHLNDDEPGVELLLRPQQMFVAVAVDTRFTFDLMEGAVYFAPEQCHLDSAASGSGHD